MEVELPEEAIPISIVTEDISLVIAPARYMIYCIVILNSKRPGHVPEYGVLRKAICQG